LAPRLLGRSVLSRDWSLFCGAWAAPGLLTFLFVHIGQVVYVQVFIAAFFLVLGPALAQTAAAPRPAAAPAADHSRPKRRQLQRRRIAQDLFEVANPFEVRLGASEFLGNSVAIGDD